MNLQLWKALDINRFLSSKFSVNKCPPSFSQNCYAFDHVKLTVSIILWQILFLSSSVYCLWRQPEILHKTFKDNLYFFLFLVFSLIHIFHKIVYLYKSCFNNIPDFKHAEEFRSDTHCSPFLHVWFKHWPIISYQILRYIQYVNTRDIIWW